VIDYVNARAPVRSTIAFCVCFVPIHCNRLCRLRASTKWYRKV
jgi:hypothetical protein